MNWLDITQLILLVTTCWVCYNAGKIKGVSELVEILLEKKMLTEKDFEKLEQ